MIQRATLLNSILADLYGPQQLLQDGLPPELVFPNPAFLRPCCGVPVPGNVYLHIYAADLARSPDGHWWVIADRTQAPSGAGYALENRLVSARVLPDVFRTAHIHRLATFFQTYRETLQSLAPGRKENPRIVVLTPGPYNETYFEHAFLARYLGYTLVEGGDLTVRDNQVFLKTLGRPAAGGRDRAAAGRYLLRSAGTACRLHAGRAGADAGGAIRDCDDRQRAGLGAGGIGRSGEFSAGAVPPRAGRRTENADAWPPGGAARNRRFPMYWRTCRSW